MNAAESLEKLHTIDREYRCLERVTATLQWDQEVYLPQKGVAERADQLALLEGIAHRRLVAPEIATLFAETGSTAENPRGDESLPPLERDFLRVMRRRYDRAVLLPPEFVSESARAEGISQAAWAQARQHNDFSAFLPHLKTMIGISRKKAGYWGFGAGSAKGALYDGLLDIYEPGMGSAEIGALFATLRDRLAVLLQRIQRCDPPDTSCITQQFPVDRQAALSQKLLGYIGFDSQRGRLDTSAHPFSTTLGSDDVRITTRYFPDKLFSGLFSVIHETGHALYEMGFPAELRGTCLADGASMAIHESQSRFWENVIGRSRPFLEGVFPLLRDFFPDQFAGVGIGQLYRAVNEVGQSPIRVDADEVSYSLHVILRFELEQRLIAGELDPEDLPAVWRMKSDELGLGKALHNSDGVLQDIHWSMGAFGYFPSYVLGNLYSLQFTQKLRQDIPELEDFIAMGKFAPVHDWLRETIYCWGSRLEPAELLQKVTGQQLCAEPFIEYLEGKYGKLYTAL